MQYLVNNKKYILSYQELKSKHNELCELPLNEFLNHIPRAIHLACIIGYLKELGDECMVSDEGIVHRLVHLLDKTVDSEYEAKETFEQFKEILKLH